MGCDKFIFSLWAVSNCQKALRSKANSKLGMPLDDLENKWVVETLKNYQHFLDDIEKIWTWGCRRGWLVEVGGWRVYVSRGNSSRFWGDFAPYLHFVVYCTSTNSSTFWYTLCGVNCWWLWLAILVTLAYTEDRDPNFSPLTQSTIFQLLPTP